MSTCHIVNMTKEQLPRTEKFAFLLNVFSIKQVYWTKQLVLAVENW